MNRAVFNNGKSHQTICDVMSIQSVDADLIYLDPPYPTLKVITTTQDAITLLKVFAQTGHMLRFNTKQKTKKFERYKSFSIQSKDLEKHSIICLVASRIKLYCFIGIR